MLAPAQHGSNYACSPLLLLPYLIAALLEWPCSASTIELVAAGMGSWPHAPLDGCMHGAWGLDHATAEDSTSKGQARGHSLSERKGVSSLMICMVGPGRMLSL